MDVSILLYIRICDLGECIRYSFELVDRLGSNQLFADIEVSYSMKQLLERSILFFARHLDSIAKEMLRSRSITDSLSIGDELP